MTTNFFHHSLLLLFLDPGSAPDPYQHVTDPQICFLNILRQGFGSGSAWIRINLSFWIRIRIRIQIADPDPDLGGQK